MKIELINNEELYDYELHMYNEDGEEIYTCEQYVGVGYNIESHQMHELLVLAYAAGASGEPFSVKELTQTTQNA